MNSIMCWVMVAQGKLGSSAYQQGHRVRKNIDYSARCPYYFHSSQLHLRSKILNDLFLCKIFCLITE